MYIYLLWDHGEDGPENLTATTDRTKLLEMAADKNVGDWFERQAVNPICELKLLLEKSDKVLAENEGIHNLMRGWGGLHLQVVKCWENED